MVVIITGASAGIGRALAEALSAHGASLSLAARRADRLEEINRTLGGQHLIVPTDVSVTVQCEALIEQTLSRFGRIDTLVCNAGYGFHAPVAQTSRRQFEQIFATNVLGTTECIRAAVPRMQAQEPRDGWRGQIMIVSSAVARRGLPFFGAYCATKAAQLSLAESLRIELWPRRIAVTSVHPIGTDTEFSEVSAQNSGGNRPDRIPGEVRQSPATVAKKTIKAMIRPRPEVWPFAPARWGVSIATLIPGIVDRVMRKRSGQIGGNDPDRVSR